MSCCVTVRNMQRCVFAIPAPHVFADVPCDDDVDAKGQKDGGGEGNQEQQEKEKEEKKRKMQRLQVRSWAFVHAYRAGPD